MTDPVDAVQTHLDNVSAMLTRAISNLGAIAGPQTPLIMQDLAQAVNGLSHLKSSMAERLLSRERQVGALVGVGNAINSSLGLKTVLAEVIDRLIALMNAERGFLMLRESDNSLVVQVARGMDQMDLEKTDFAVSNTIVRRVAETGEPVFTTNAQEDPRFGEQMSVAAFHLLSILCAPLKIKDQLIGVIYVDNRARSGIFEENDLSLISAFSNQAAVAIDNARLFDGLQESNAELQTAYQATLEGWVRALDMRDKETEGHTKRVTTLTQGLARFMGVGEEQMVHITRGALLHDIGKMAIPDGILLKPSGLTDDERALVQLHPVYAFEMLSPIKFLIPALDIPYCHHEKWDGSGYPRGLKGEEIPFAARIFAVIDVWDALISDRPYRKGLPADEIKTRVKKDSGLHFDPQVVEAFMKFIEIK